MYPILLPIYGPFAIQSYGVAALVGVLLFVWHVRKHPVIMKAMSQQEFQNLCLYGLCVTLIGARILHLVSYWQQYRYIREMFQLWKGGLSLLGGLMALALYVPWYLYRRKIAILPFMDACAVYAPLVQCMGRIGCFFAGCCYGIPTSKWWGITYTNPQCHAPLGVAMHPTQLYSALFLIVLFGVLYSIEKKNVVIQPGYRALLYLFLAGIERFISDFWRADRTFITQARVFSLDQYAALALAGVSFLVLIICMIMHNSKQIVSR